MEHIQSFSFETVRFAKTLNIQFCIYVYTFYYFLFVFVRGPQGRIALELIGLPPQKNV